MKRLLTLILCLCLLLSSTASLAAGMSGSADRYNVSDTKAPNIIKFTFDEDGKTLKPGDTLHIKFKLDEQSDIDRCLVYFNNLQSYECFIDVWAQYDAASDMYKGEYTLKKSDINGKFSITRIIATDQYYNDTQIRDPKGNLGSFTLKGAEGLLKGTAKIQGNGKTVRPEELVHITAKLDQDCPDAYDIIVVFSPTDYDNASLCTGMDKTSARTLEGDFFFSEFDRNGKYALRCIVFQDEDGNPLAVLNVTGQYLYLTGSYDEKEATAITSVTVKEKGKKLTAGDTLHVSAKVAGKSTDLELQCAFRNTEGEIVYTDEATGATVEKNMNCFYIDLKYNKSTGRYEGSGKLPKDLPDGEYYVEVRSYGPGGTYKSKKSETFTYTSPDFADKGIKSFITVCWKAFFGKKPTKAEINEYGTPLAAGKKKAVNVINTLLKKSKLSGEDAAIALWQVMQGKNPSDSQKAKTVAALKEGKDIAIDSLNNSAFRKRCNEWGINPGTLDTGKASTKVASVDVDGGHYTLNGSKATFTGATQKDVKSLVIPDTVKANGKTYKVTKIEGAACKGLKKLSSVTIGKNVTAIGQDAFKDCKALKTVTINAAKLKTVGKDSFSGISKKAVFKLPKKQLSAYKKLIKKNGGAPGTAKYQEK